MKGLTLACAICGAASPVWAERYELRQGLSSRGSVRVALLCIVCGAAVERAISEASRSAQRMQEREVSA